MSIDSENNNEINRQAEDFLKLIQSGGTIDAALREKLLQALGNLESVTKIIAETEIAPNNQGGVQEEKNPVF